jgi:hypothetical protein
MTNIYFIMTGIMLFVAILALLDWIGRRQQRASKRQS